MSLVFFDGNLVWSQEGDITKIAVLLSSDGEERAPDLRRLARITLEGSDTVLSLDGVDFTLKADYLGEAGHVAFIVSTTWSAIARFTTRWSSYAPRSAWLRRITNNTYAPLRNAKTAHGRRTRPAERSFNTYLYPRLSVHQPT